MKPHCLPAGAVDFHAHILPGMDHGSRDLTEATAQWRMFGALDLFAVVATPHFYAQTESSVEEFVARRDAAAELLMTNVSGGPRLALGAEVLLFRGLENMTGLDRLCIKGTNVLLLEMPYGGFGRAEVVTVERIAALGLCPLIAHIDRYPTDALRLLYQSGCARYQVNAEGMLGLLRRRAAYFRKMARDGLVVAIGSDLHGTDMRALRRFSRACGRLGDTATAVMSESRDLLANASLI